MISPEVYLATVRDRLVQDGCEVTEERVGSLQPLVGDRSNVKALSKIHLFTAVASAPRVDEAVV